MVDHSALETVLAHLKNVILNFNNTYNLKYLLHI